MELSTFYFNLLAEPQPLYLVDCCVQLNPHYNDNEQEERSIQEMQLTVFDQQVFECKGQKMTNLTQGKPVTDPKVMFKRQAIVEHI
jgi:hypothetical protein